MKIKQQVINAYRAFTNKSLYNSNGLVMRNYAQAPEFRPFEQVQGITYKAIDKIGLSLSVYVPRVKKANGDAYENHPLYNVFRQPNPHQSASDFIHLYAMLFEIYGETFWYKARGERSNKVKEIYLLNPAQVEIKVTDGELVGYVLHKANGEQVPLTVDDIIHDKRPNPFNEWRGLSVVEKASTYIDTEIVSSRFTMNYIKNSASPSGIVSLPNMTPEAFTQFTQRWREGYEGPENAGKTAFIRGGEADFKAVGATLKDIDQEVTRKMAKDDVLMMLDVPKPLIGLTDAQGFGRGNLEALEYTFAKYKLEPMMRRLDLIYQQLMQELGVGAGIVSHESPVPEDKEFILKQDQAAVNVWMTVNEIRSRQGFDPIPGGDDLVPENAIAPPTKVISESVKVTMKKKLTKAQETKKINQEQEEFRTNLVKTNDLYASKLKSEISKFAAKQEKTVIDKINATSKTYEEWLFTVKEESEELTAVLTPLMIELMEAQGEDVANFITGELLTISPEQRIVVENHIKRIAGLYNEDTLHALEKTLTEGQAQGESLAKLKKRVESTYSDAQGYRAERIARTESLRASNRTAELVYQQNGFTKVQWFVNPGACQFCASFAGRTREIGGKYANIGDVITGTEEGQMRIEYDTIDVPPLHPNCTCTINPV